MRLSLRFVGPLFLALAGIAYAVVPLVDRLTLKWFVRDLDMRSTLIANTVSDSLIAALSEPRPKPLVLKLFNSVVQDERVYAIGLCDPYGKLLYSSRLFPPAVRCEVSAAPKESRMVQIEGGPLYSSSTLVASEDSILGRLMILHDMSFVRTRSEDTKKYVFYLFTAIAAVVALITMVIAELSWRGWVSGIKALISGHASIASSRLRSPPRELQPIARDLKALVAELEAERFLQDDSQIAWGPDSLRRILREDLKGDEILIVSNREPYIHVRTRRDCIEIQRPASGLVTALEPVMRACSGTWIAHGSGSADRDSVDRNDRVMVPPEEPSYRIRRVWLTPEEEKGYYYGFANEGLWPLCHIAHTRPTFRAQDWRHYCSVNKRFASVISDEAKSDDPIVLVQDYHFALLPQLIRERLPRATIITFWHIPWPNPEAFGILPWREELLSGLLGSSILGFHTQFHSNNFFDTVDRYLEARVDRETFQVSFGGNPTEVRRYPISIEWPPQGQNAQGAVQQCRAETRRGLRLPDDALLGIGIDRLDYTKGILERFMAIERLLEMQPDWIGRFSFLQIAAPSRSLIEDYQTLERRVRSLAQSINARFGKGEYLPIHLVVEHRNSRQVNDYYRAADLCCVSSLHDGMNLVAKEYVAARDDERGVLILSQFTGAARELVEALIINPYDIEQTAAAFHLALTMPAAEQQARMKSMRGLVREFNVYRWAGRMLMDAARMRHRQRVLARSGHAGYREGRRSDQIGLMS